MLSNFNLVNPARGGSRRRQPYGRRQHTIFQNNAWNWEHFGPWGDASVAPQASLSPKPRGRKVYLRSYRFCQSKEFTEELKQLWPFFCQMTSGHRSYSRDTLDRNYTERHQMPSLLLFSLVELCTWHKHEVWLTTLEVKKDTFTIF